MFARRAAALLLAAVLLVGAIPAAFAEEEGTPEGEAVTEAVYTVPTTIGGADTALLPAEEENCLSWLFGSKDTITMPYLNIKGKGLRRNVKLNLVDCLVGITYTELGSIGSFVSASAAQEAWKAQAVAIHSYLEYHKKYGSSANALIYTPVDQIPASARSAIEKAVRAVKDEVLTYNGSVIDAVWSASAGYNTQTGVYGTCSGLDAWGTDVPYLQSVESPYEEQYHNLMRRIIGKDYRYIEYNDSKTGQPYESADTTHKDLGGFVQYNTFVSNGKSYRYIGQFVSSRYCFDFSADENGTPCMNYYGFGHGVGMSQCGAVGFAADFIGCLFSPFGYNPIFCLPPILYGLWAGLVRRYVWRRPTLWRAALAVFPAAVCGSVLWQSMALALVYGGAAKWPYFLTRLAARSVQFAITGCIDALLVWLLMRRNALSPVLRRIKTKGGDGHDAG